MKNFSRAGELLLFYMHILSKVAMYTHPVSLPRGQILISKSLKNDKNKSSTCKEINSEADEAYSQYLASLIYETQIKLKSKQENKNSTSESINLFCMINRILLQIFKVNFPRYELKTLFGLRYITPIIYCAFIFNFSTINAQDVTGHFIQAETNELKIKLLKESGKYNIDRFPVETYKLDEDLIIPIRLGDTLPESILNLPLTILNKQGNMDTILLKNVSDEKLIVLDFWHQHCSPCVVSMEKWNKYLNQVKDSIYFLGVFVNFQYYLEPYLKQKQWNTSSVFGLNAFVLAKHFFHQPIAGNLAWIKNKRLYAITSSNKMEIDKIKGLIESELMLLSSNQKQWAY